MLFACKTPSIINVLSLTEHFNSQGIFLSNLIQTNSFLPVVRFSLTNALVSRGLTMTQRSLFASSIHVFKFRIMQRVFRFYKTVNT